MKEAGFDHLLLNGVDDFVEGITTGSKFSS